MTTLRRSMLPFVLLVTAACGGGEEAPPPDAAPVDRTLTGFSTPESVLHDATADVYLVSNIEGAPAEADGTAFISRIDAGTLEVVERRWIDGAAEGIELHAPKGMALHGGLLYVADIDHVRTFDRETGEPAESYAIEGASFLNDVAVGPDGRIHVTDTGVEPDFSAAGTDAVYRLGDDGEAEALASGEELGQPNGIAAGDTAMFVCGWKSAEVYELDADGRRTVLWTLPAGQLDGLVRLEDGRWLVSGWEAGCIYRLDRAGGHDVYLEDLKAPADFGVDHGRRRLLIPLFQSDGVRVVTLED